MLKIKGFIVVLIGVVLLCVYPGAAAAGEGSATGWALKGGKWRYYDHGVMKTSWVFDSNKWYFLDQGGSMKTGWVLNGGKWYYLDGSGAMQTGWVLDGRHWYYLDKTGAMKTGWLLDGGRWYYLDKNGVMKTGWVAVDGKWYYLAGSGAMQTGWVKELNNWYYLDSNGAMVTGWQSISGNWYYFDTQYGGMVRQNFVGGYYLMNDGRMTYAGSADVVSVVEGLKKWIDVGITKSALQAEMGDAYHDLEGIEGENYWLYTLKVDGAADYKAVKWAADDLGAEDLANGSADIIVLAYWDRDEKAFQVTIDYFNAAHKFHHYHSSKFDYEYN